MLLILLVAQSQLLTEGERFESYLGSQFLLLGTPSPFFSYISQVIEDVMEEVTCQERTNH